MLRFAPLWKLYLPLIGWVGLGLLLGHRLPRSVPQRLGQFLFWVGVPLSILAFLRQADLSAATWMAPVVAWAAILLGAGLAWSWIWLQLRLQGHLHNPQTRSHQLRKAGLVESRPTQASFLLTAMVGNTGYLGYPITLALLGSQYFGWAVFYDTLGSALGSYGLGVVLAAHFSQPISRPGPDQPDLDQPGPDQPDLDANRVQPVQRLQLLKALLYNPALWSFGLGLGFRQLPLPGAVERGLELAGWTVVALSLLLIGMRLSQLRGWQNLPQAAVSLSIKMLIVPLIVGLGLPYCGVHGLPRLVIVLQAAMPPAFATLVIAEAYDLDQGLTVTSLALGSVLLLLLLPVWLWLFWPA